MGDIVLFLGAVGTAPPGDTAQFALAFQRNDLRVGVHGDVRAVLDTADQVARHALGQPIGAHQHMNLVAGPGQKDGGLAGRVAAADDDDFLVLTKLRFQVGRGVIDAGAQEARQVFDFQRPVLRAAGDQHNVGTYRAAFRQIHHVRPPLAVQCYRLRGDTERGAEFLRLRQRAPGQRQTGNAGGKAKVVFDLGAGAGLSARCRGFHQAHVESLGGAVDRGCQPGRPGAHNQQVMHPGFIDRRIDAKAARHLEVARILKHPLATAYDHRYIFGGHMEAFQYGLRVGVSIDIERGERDRITGKEFAQPQRVGGMTRADQHHIAAVFGQQSHAPQNERPHE